MSTYYRKDNTFYKVDGEVIRSIKLGSTSALIEIEELVDNGASEIKEEDYASALASVVKFGFVGGHPDIPPVQ